MNHFDSVGHELEHSHPLSLLPRGFRDTSDKDGSVAGHNLEVYQTLYPGASIHGIIASVSCAGLAGSCELLSRGRDTNTTLVEREG